VIFTERFVFVHQPKTGGTFVRTALRRLYEGGTRAVVPTWYGLVRYKDVHLRAPRYGLLIEHPKKHAARWRVPLAHRRKPLLGIIRNPYDWYVSQYEFGWWRQPQYLPWFRRVPGFTSRYPTFPKIRFDEYVRLINSAFGVQQRCAGEEDGAIGLYTEEFARFYFRFPWLAVRRVSAEFVAAGRHARELRGVGLLRTERLNEDLFGFLCDVGYPPDDLAFVRELGRVLPDGKGRSACQSWQTYYTPELKDWVRRKERVMFALCPEYDR
jgi:hypothetical protein